MIYIKKKKIIDFYNYSCIKNPKIIRLRIIILTCIAKLFRCRQIILWNPCANLCDSIFSHNIKVMGFYDLDMASDACIATINPQLESRFI